jgi:hypothetical protein
MPGTDIRQDADVRPDLSFGDGDHERFAHYVDKDKIVDSAVTGTPVVALCGKVWVPSRDPKKFPVCPDCQRIYATSPFAPGAISRAPLADRHPAGRGRRRARICILAVHPSCM